MKKQKGTTCRKRVCVCACVCVGGKGLLVHACQVKVAAAEKQPNYQFPSPWNREINQVTTYKKKKKNKK